MFPFKTGGELYVFAGEKAQKLLANVVKNPDIATYTGSGFNITCSNTFAIAFLNKVSGVFTLDGYTSKDAETLYNAIKKVKKSREVF